jgi:cell volume regulation protein A
MDIFQIILTLAVLIIIGYVSLFLSKKFMIPRVAILLVLGFICGITRLLHWEWFDPLVEDPGALIVTFPLGLLVRITLIIVLFFGGYSINIESLKGILRPGILLATLGAFVVTFIIGLLVRYTFIQAGTFGILTSLIIGALIAPNDPIAVNSTQNLFKLNPKADTISKFESGLDDTMVTTLIILVFIPIALELENIGVPTSSDVWRFVGLGILRFLWLTFSAITLGVLLGWAFTKIYKLTNSKTVRIAIILLMPWIIFLIGNISIKDFAISSGYVAVFVAGLVFGRTLLKEHKEYNRNFNIWEPIFKVCEVFSFVILGTLVSLARIKEVIVPALLITFALIFITRPIEMLLCTRKTDLLLKDKLYIAYIGLKGLDPAVLAITAYESLYLLKSEYVKGIDLIINLTFSVILLVTICQSVILAALFGKKGYYAKKEGKLEENKSKENDL